LLLLRNSSIRTLRRTEKPVRFLDLAALLVESLVFLNEDEAITYNYTPARDTLREKTSGALYRVLRVTVLAQGRWANVV
jgi:hypothetical protein